MNNLPRIIHLATTDPEFRAALQTDPQVALAERGLKANSEELAALTELRALIAVPPQKLSALLAVIPNNTWWYTMPSTAVPVT